MFLQIRETFECVRVVRNVKTSAQCVTACRAEELKGDSGTVFMFVGTIKAFFLLRHEPLCGN